MNINVRWLRLKAYFWFKGRRAIIGIWHVLGVSRSPGALRPTNVLPRSAVEKWGEI